MCYFFPRGLYQIHLISVFGSSQITALPTPPVRPQMGVKHCPRCWDPKMGKTDSLPSRSLHSNGRKSPNMQGKGGGAGADE